MLSMTQMDMANNILTVMNDLDNYPDHAPHDVLPGEGWRFTDDGILQAIADATGDWAYAGHLSDEVWEYRKRQAGLY